MSGVLVPLRGSYASGRFAIVDDADADRVLALKWYVASDKRGPGYVAHARRVGCKRKNVLLHRFILGVDDPKQLIDHANGDPFDNRRSNLRLCSSRENRQNMRASKNQKAGLFKGVERMGRKWRAAIGGVMCSDGQRRKLGLGLYTRPVDAAVAYDLAAIEHFGPFAATNFPNVQQVIAALHALEARTALPAANDIASHHRQPKAGAA